MFERFGALTYRFRFVVVAAWIAVAGGALFLAPSLAGEGMTDQSAFLPAEARSMQARDSLDRAFPGDSASISATIAFAREGGLTDADRAFVESVAAWITSRQAPAVLREAVAGVDTAGSRPELEAMLRSDDGELELMTVNMNVSIGGQSLAAVVEALRDRLVATDAPGGLQANVTGTAGISSDYLDSIVRGTDSTTAVTVVLVVVILLLIYRAPLAALVPLVTIGAAFLVARGTLGLLAAAGWKLSSLLDTFLVVLVFGIGTDYAIFLISRFREEVGQRTWREASIVTVGRIGAVIAASAGTVIVGLGSMAFGDFGMIQTTGPALGIAVFVTLIAGLTLTPALLAIFGHYLFWPLRPRTTSSHETRGLFAALAATVSRRPGLVTLILLATLLIPAAAVPQMRTNFDVLAELPAGSDARAGFDQVAEHLGRGMVVHATGVVEQGPGGDILSPGALSTLHEVTAGLVSTPGIESVTSIVTPEGDGVLPDELRPSHQLATMADEFESRDEPSPNEQPSAEPAILDPQVDDGLATLQGYLAGLADAFPEVADGRALGAAVADVAEARQMVADARLAGEVPRQLRQLRHALLVPSTRGGDTSSAGILSEYLDELAAAFPQVRDEPAFGRATTAAAVLADERSATAVLDLSEALDDLASSFDQRPNAVLYPNSLAGSDTAIARRREIEATFDRIPRRLDALAAILAERPDDVFVPTSLDGEGGDDIEAAVDAFVSADRTATRFYVTTTDDPYAASAFDSIRSAQDALAASAPAFGPNARAELGGPTAQVADVQEVLARDFQRVGVITVLGILLVLIVLLRAVVAPLYLVGTVLLSCASAIGLSSWYFQNVLGQPGVSFYLPLMVFVLLVALGSDYNIFLMSRVREESERRPIREGIRIASGRTGAVITSAGLILAGTFGSMASAALIVLFQIGVAVAVGVLIDTFLVRSILVPAITTLFGERAWWPSGTSLVGTIRRSIAGVMLEPLAGTLPDGEGSRPAFGARQLAALALVVVLPVTFAGLLVWAFGNPAGHLDAVSAAVVDEDQGARVVRDIGSAEWIDLGSDLTAKLTSEREDATFTWEATDAAEAADGLADGRYGAVLTIPADFSGRIAAIRAGEASASDRAVLRLETNDATDASLGTIAGSLTMAIADSTSRTVVSSYVDDVLLAVSGARDDVTATAAQADELAADASDLTDGAAGAASTTGALVTGLRELSAATNAAGDGVQQLTTGVGQLAGGSAALADGVAAIDSAAEIAADGAVALSAGVEALADGLDTMARETVELPEETSTLAAGARSVADGATDLSTGVEALADGLDEMESRSAGLGAQATELEDGAAAISDGAEQLASSSTDLAAGAGSLSANAADLANGVDTYTTGVSELAANCEAFGGGEPLCTQLRALAETGPALETGAAQVAVGSERLAASGAAMRDAAAGLSEGAGALAAGTSTLANAAPDLEAGIAATAAGARHAATGAGALAVGSAQLADGVQVLAAFAPDLSRGIADAAGGASTLRDGSTRMAAGLTRLEDGTDRLKTAASAVADGASKLAVGTAEAAGGATKLAEGTDQVADGARVIGAEIDALRDSGGDLAERSALLRDRLDGTAERIPVDSDVHRATTGRLVADPIDVVTDRLNAVSAMGSNLAPYFMALAAWVGALAIFLVMPAIADRRDGRVGGGSRAFAAAVAIGIAQFVVMGLVLTLVLGVSVARPVALVAIGVIATVTFVAVCQALVAVFGSRGWLLTLAFVAVQLAAAGGAYPVQTAPGPLQAIHPLLPMTHAVEGMRALLAGGGDAGPALVVLGAWLAGALAVTAVAARRRRDHAPRRVALAT